MKVNEPNVNTGCSCNCNCSNSAVSDTESKKLTEILERHKGQNGPLMPVLNKIQDCFGYLPRFALEEVSKTFNVPLAEIYGVATFYSRFTLKPRGEHTISVCLGTACYVRGAKDVFSKIVEELKVNGSGDTTEDGKFTLEATRCFGCCGLAPVMMIDDDVYGKLTPDKIPEILKKY
jgi:NADH:ubiquinone oxidoreductase subunit E